jgi:ABC-type uncharacterized transport system auxiliary subunit
MNRLTMTLAVALLAGCTGGFERDAPEPALYVLSAPRVEATAMVRLPSDLIVLRPALAPALATERMATRWPGNRIDYYADARWSGDAGLVVQAALVESLRGTGNYQSVEADPGRFRPTHVLGVEVSRLEADYTNGAVPVARVVMTATVARHPDRRSLSTWTVSAERQAADNTLTAVTAALDEAFSSAALEIVTGTTGAIGTDLRSQP